LDPRSVFRGLVFGRDGLVLVETSEMVDPDKIHRFQKDPYSEFPPGISGRFHRLPKKKRIPPALSGWTEIIRRNSCHPDRITIRIQFKPLGVGPYVGTFMSDKNRQATNQTYPFFMCTIFQPLPLAEKKKLGKTVESEGISVLFLCPILCGRLAFFEFLRLFGPGFFSENFP